MSKPGIQKQTPGGTDQATRTPAVAPASPPEPTADRPFLPHDRDEKAGATGGIASPDMQQGARDVERGLSDTTRAPEADDAYRKLKK